MGLVKVACTCQGVTRVLRARKTNVTRGLLAARLGGYRTPCGLRHGTWRRHQSYCAQGDSAALEHDSEKLSVGPRRECAATTHRRQPNAVECHRRGFPQAGAAPVRPLGMDEDEIPDDQMEGAGGDEEEMHEHGPLRIRWAGTSHTGLGAELALRVEEGKTHANKRDKTEKAAVLALDYAYMEPKVEADAFETPAAPILVGRCALSKMTFSE
eukprot:3648970-Amphidinium_carterae.1